MELGGHLRSEEGLKFVPMEARALGYNVVQIMLSEELEWVPYRLDEAGAMEYRKTMFGIKTYVHLPFTINPCEDAPRKRQFARVTFRRFAKAAQSLGTTGLVLHPGFKKNLPEEEALLNLVMFFDDLMDDDTRLEVLLETDTGSKNESKVGSLEFIEQACIAVDNPAVAMCVDTAHLYARGVDLWDEAIREEVYKKYARLIKLIHLNVPDENVGLGGHLDRHNSPFQDYPCDSTGLIKDSLTWPCILERRSLAIQEMDVKFIHNLIGE